MINIFQTKNAIPPVSRSVLEDASIIWTAFSGENFRTQGTVTHSIEAIERQPQTLRNSEHNPHSLHENKNLFKTDFN